ncbi:MAG: Stp1/IreP family PP2C-type Ser/Thr phosphatase, partial [Acidimicrobiales bacterium]
MTTFRIGAASDVGRVRSNNQDSKLVTDDLYAVADGMGGHLGGEVASAIAVETLRSSVSEPTIDGVISGVRMANRAIYTRSASDPDLRGMGTTLCAVARVEVDGGHDQLTIVNVGDSRGYLLRGGDLTQITRDHSLVEDLRAEGRLTAEEAAVHPHRNIVTRALGIDPDVEVDHTEVDPLPGDRYVLCSDGLTNEVTLDKLGATLRRLADPQDAADELVRLANDNGGRDNITVVVVDIVEGGGSPATAAGAVAGEQRDQTAVAPAVPAAPREGNTQSTVVPPPPAADATAPASGPGDAGLEPKPVSVAPAEPAVHTRRFTWR